MARVWSGVVPQQPPTRRAPAATASAANRPRYSGELEYMTRSSIRIGQPAFGIVATGTSLPWTDRAWCAIASTMGSILPGPIEQFAPITSTPSSSSSATTSSSELPAMVVASSAKLIRAISGRSEFARTARTATTISRRSEMVSIAMPSTPPSRRAPTCSA